MNHMSLLVETSNRRNVRRGIRKNFLHQLRSSCDGGSQTASIALSTFAQSPSHCVCRSVSCAHRPDVRRSIPERFVLTRQGVISGFGRASPYFGNCPDNRY